MSKFFKGIAKVVKNIGKGIKKVFKKVVKSKLFKVALVAVAVYFGGAALGLWGGAGATGAATAAVGGTVAPAATTAAATTSLAAPVSTATLAATTAAPITTAGLATGAEVAGALTAAAPAASTIGAGVASATEIAGALTTAAPAAGAGSSFLSSLATGAKAVGGFVKANPLAASMGLNAISSAMAPDELDLIEAREDSRAREFDQALTARRQNLTGFNTLPLLHQATGTGNRVQNRRTGGE